MVTGAVRRDRAQMILVGALTLAAVIVGLTVIVNSQFVTQTGSVSQVSPQVDEAREFEYESRKSVRSLVLRLNHRHRNLTGGELDGVVDSNVNRYGDIVAESYASSRGSHVEIGYTNASSRFGSRVVQAADGNVTSGDDEATWSIGESGEPRDIGWFTMNVNVDDTDDTRTWINVTNATGHAVNVSINRTTVGSGVNLRVASNVSHGGNATALCDSSRDRALLDVRDGTAFTGGCQFNGTAAVEPPYTVHVSGGDGTVAKYELVYNETVASPTDYGPCEATSSAPVDQPCRTPAVWVANVTTEFSGNGLTYGNEYNVSVYEGAR